jgi:tetratricopeptide (TPR) repeat protein
MDLSKVSSCIYYLDIFQSTKKYTSEIHYLTDTAVLFDPKSAESLTAKSVYYIQNKEYELAVPYLEKALEYNPNSILVINFLTDMGPKNDPAEKHPQFEKIMGVKS